MNRTDGKPIRICEYGATEVPELTKSQRFRILEATAEWFGVDTSADLPLSFSGPEGSRLIASDHVGVVEVAGCTIEIYPKLDRNLLNVDRVPDGVSCATTMQNLLWMMQVAGFMEITEADAGHLANSPSPFYDIFAYLMAKNLREQLEAGVVHSYRPEQDDLPCVRGRIDILDQVTRNWNRFDRIACCWDEFTPDIHLNQILKCSCTVLKHRVQSFTAFSALDDCCVMLDEVSNIDISTAASLASSLVWDRANDRYRRCFDMALRMLTGASHQMASGSVDSFVFLLDMKYLFEAYVKAALVDRFGSSVQAQRPIGHLFTRPGNLIAQKPDYIWNDRGTRWIGDAKYKRLEVNKGVSSVRPDDVRQVTVYAELMYRQEKCPRPNVAIICPDVSNPPEKIAISTTWNGSTFVLIPVRVAGIRDIAEILPVLTADHLMAGTAAVYSPSGNHGPIGSEESIIANNRMELASDCKI
jgi:5-methylcytosine-specific restriction enzyme subunit McrC